MEGAGVNPRVNHFMLWPFPGVTEMPIPLLVIMHDIAEAG